MHPTDDSAHLEIKQERFQMLEDIAKELAGEICFPCCLDVSLRIRSALRNPGISEEELIAVIRVEPLICSTLIGLANSPAYNPESKQNLSLAEAIQRLGPPLARNIAQKLATEQLFSLKELVNFSSLSTLLWEHSITCAAAASVLAKHFTRINPEEAMLAGLLHDIGAFYMLYKANQYPELKSHPETMQYLIMQWHESIGESIINSLGLPESLSEALRDHDLPRQLEHTPSTLQEVIFVANLLSGAIFEWQRNDLSSAEITRTELANPIYVELFDEINTLRLALLAPFEKQAGSPFSAQ